MPRLAITHARISQSLIPPKRPRSNFNVQSQALLAWAHARDIMEIRAFSRVAFEPESNYEAQEIHSTLLFPINSRVSTPPGRPFRIKDPNHNIPRFTLVNFNYTVLV